MSYEITELDELWRKGEGDIPDKLKRVVEAAQEEMLLRSLQLSADAENTIRHNAGKSNKTVNEYLAALIMAGIQSV